MSILRVCGSATAAEGIYYMQYYIHSIHLDEKFNHLCGRYCIPFPSGQKNSSHLVWHKSLHSKLN